jgi:hypothetical protein
MKKHVIFVFSNKKAPSVIFLNIFLCPLILNIKISFFVNSIEFQIWRDLNNLLK